MTADRIDTTVISFSDYWKGYLDAIRHADIALQCRGDDRLTRYARRDVLKLAGAKYDPAHAVPIPEWPPEQEWIAAQPGGAHPIRAVTAPSKSELVQAIIIAWRSLNIRLGDDGTQEGRARTAARAVLTLSPNSPENRASTDDALRTIIERAENDPDARAHELAEIAKHALAGKSPDRGWMPIDTAPKDGTNVLVIDMRGKQPEASFVHFRDDKWICAERSDWEDTDAQWQAGCAWYENPSHWMPLPAPPITSGSGEKE